MNYIHKIYDYFIDYFIDLSTNLKKYDISKYGFLPEKCVTDLPTDFVYITNLLKLFDDSQYKKIIQDLDLQKQPDLEILNFCQLKYLYSILSMIIHRYMWNNLDNIISELPHHIGMLFVDVAKKINIVPCLTHASVDLYNWKLIDETIPFSLDNITTINTMILDKDSSHESWFYLIMIAIEGIGGDAIIAMEKIYKELYKYYPSYSIITEELHKINNIIFESNKIISRIYEKCDPEVFYNKLRIFLNGTNNSLFKNGLQIRNTDIILSYTGGSGAQSSLIQLYDIFFSIKHNCKFLDDMRNYMPKIHSEYLTYAETRNTIKNFLSNNHLSTDECIEITKLFNMCIKNLTKFRSNHRKLIMDYIMKFVKENTENKGTGGSNPIEFTTELLNTTISSKINRC